MQNVWSVSPVLVSLWVMWGTEGFKHELEVIFTAGDKAGERGGTIIPFFILCWIHVAIKDAVSDGFFLFFALDDVREKEYSWYGLRHNNCCQHPSAFKALCLLQRASRTKVGSGCNGLFWTVWIMQSCFSTAQEWKQGAANEHNKSPCVKKKVYYFLQ